MSRLVTAISRNEDIKPGYGDMPTAWATGVAREVCKHGVSSKTPIQGLEVKS